MNAHLGPILQERPKNRTLAGRVSCCSLIESLHMFYSDTQHMFTCPLRQSAELETDLEPASWQWSPTRLALKPRLQSACFDTYKERLPRFEPAGSALGLTLAFSVVDVPSIWCISTCSHIRCFRSRTMSVSSYLLHHHLHVHLLSLPGHVWDELQEHCRALRCCFHCYLTCTTGHIQIKRAHLHDISSAIAPTWQRHGSFQHSLFRDETGDQSRWMQTDNS